MIFARLRRRRNNRLLIEQIHGEIVAAARAPALYRRFAVADTLEGRFEMVVLYAALTVRRLLALGPAGAEIAQEVVDAVFRGFEDALREMAIGDAGVARRIKAMGADFGGRSRAYRMALDAGDQAALTAALGRNVYGAAASEACAMLAARVAATAAALDTIAYESFAAGQFHFPRPAGEAP
ncbi:MAG: ubiquinol-cytochrome C chaperone [Bradyrhizobium sp.]|nr:MAG: ubiquinol-cytochrome C chaperone [Bradyrhizobium sp.]